MKYWYASTVTQISPSISAHGGHWMKVDEPSHFPFTRFRKHVAKDCHAKSPSNVTVVSFQEIDEITFQDMCSGDQVILGSIE